jgi:putative salt-induced outer membrane protein YdiY
VAAASLLALATLASPRAANAQVNIDALRPEALRDGWQGSVEASFALSRGNIELVDVGGSARAVYQSLYAQSEAEKAAKALSWVHHSAVLSVSGRFATRSGEAFVSQGLAYARWNAMWHRRVGTDLFAQYQFNEFLRLKGRVMGGAGGRFELVHTEPLLLWAGAAYLLEYERIDVDPGAVDPPETITHRLTAYLAARVATFGGRLLAQNVVYVQPRIDAPNDLRVLDELEVQAKATDAFSLGITASLLHDSEPPVGVRDTDLRLLTTARLSL